MDQHNTIIPATYGWFIIRPNPSALRRGGHGWTVHSSNTSPESVGTIEVTSNQPISFHTDAEGGPTPDVNAWIRIIGRLALNNEVATIHLGDEDPDELIITGTKSVVEAGGPNPWRLYHGASHVKLCRVIIKPGFLRLCYDPTRGPDDGPRIWVQAHGRANIIDGHMRIHLQLLRK